jgi:beta-glucosidase
MNRFQSLPDSLELGAATSALQIEGAALEDGRGKTFWDVTNRDEHGRPTGDVPDIACDHYHRYKEDVRLMKELGLQTYRFSISWPRIMPQKDVWNEDGIAFYHRLLDELEAAGIAPAVTIWHGDPPLWFDEQGGWKNRASIEDYVRYANKLFDCFGGRVKRWFTHNEPWCAAFLNGEPFGTQLQIAHHLLVAHARAVLGYRAHPHGNGEIGIVLNLSKQYPATYRDQDVLAARMVDGFLNRWFLDPVLKGRYPQDMVERYREEGHAFGFEPADFALWNEAKSDFLGFNMYSRGIQAYESNNTLLFARDVKNEEAAYSDMGWEVAPQSLYDLIMDLKASYGDIPLIVAENGGAFPDDVLKDGVVQDDDRLHYLKTHLASVAQAIRHGADVRAYYVWSLFDNFEWGLGYSKRFGIVRVDYDTLKRTIKRSGRFYQEVLAKRGFRVDD